MYIKVCVSEKEKQQLESIAAKRKVPLSKLCYDQIYPLFSNPLTGALIFLEKSPMDEKCTESVTVHLTPSEHHALIQNLAELPYHDISGICFFYDFKPITISIFTEDIALLSRLPMIPPLRSETLQITLMQTGNLFATLVTRFLSQKLKGLWKSGFLKMKAIKNRELQGVKAKAHHFTLALVLMSIRP